MLRILNARRPITSRDLPRVAIAGGRDRRELMKRSLAGRAMIVGELESGSRIHLFGAVEPDIILIDTKSISINMLQTITMVQTLPASATIVLIGDASTRQLLRCVSDLPVVHIRDVASVVCPDRHPQFGTEPEPSSVAA